MGFIGGDILEVKYNHPSLGSGTFYPKAAEDSTFDTGGLRTNDDANQITGAGQAIRQMNNTRWRLETTLAADQNTAQDLQKLAALAGHPDEATWTISHSNGTTWKGKGFPVGDVQYNGNAATMPLILAGGGGMAQI